MPQVRGCEGPDAPSRIRTCGLLLRRESLYPAELSGLWLYQAVCEAGAEPATGLDGTFMAHLPPD
jgi:hypothetical protein